MRFLLFISHWLLKINLIYIHHYTDIQSTHWYIYIHTTINTHNQHWQVTESIFFDVWQTIYMNILQKPAYYRYTHKLQRTSQGHLKKLYTQLLNSQYFLAVAFKSTNCHADSSIYWHSLYEAILFACNGHYVLSRMLPSWVLDTIGTKGGWQWLWTLVPLFKVRHWKGIWEKKQWQSTSLSPVRIIL